MFCPEIALTNKPIITDKKYKRVVIDFILICLFLVFEN
jgi:hypothetical protein